MAHSDPPKPEPARRDERSNAGSPDDPARGRAGAPRPQPQPDDASQAPESGEKPDVMPPQQRPAR